MSWDVQYSTFKGTVHSKCITYYFSKMWIRPSSTKDTIWCMKKLNKSERKYNMDASHSSFLCMWKCSSLEILKTWSVFPSLHREGVSLCEVYITETLPSLMTYIHCSIISFPCTRAHSHTNKLTCINLDVSYFMQMCSHTCIDTHRKISLAHKTCSSADGYRRTWPADMVTWSAYWTGQQPLGGKRGDERMGWWNQSAALIVCRQRSRQLCLGSSMLPIVGASLWIWVNSRRLFPSQKTPSKPVYCCSILPQPIIVLLLLSADYFIFLSQCPVTFTFFIYTLNSLKSTRDNICLIQHPYPPAANL